MLTSKKASRWEVNGIANVLLFDKNGFTYFPYLKPPEGSVVCKRPNLVCKRPKEKLRPLP